VITDAKCMNDAASMQIAGVLNTISELGAAILPLIAVFRLSVYKAQQWKIVRLMSLGFLVVIVGGFRIMYLRKAVESFDLTWWAGPQWICSEVENYLAVMCACAVPLRPLMGRSMFKVGFTNKASLHNAALITSKSSGSLHQTRREAEPKDRAEWTSIVQSIDLEGISNDGYGYTVRISGPQFSGPPRRKSFEGRLRAVRTNLLCWSWSSDEKQSAHPATAGQQLKIPMQMEVEIFKSEREMPSRDPHWGSAATSTYISKYMDASKDQGLPEYLGNPNMLSTPSDSSDAHDGSPTIPEAVARVSGGQGRIRSISEAKVK
jgi:hypothetical protein